MYDTLIHIAPELKNVKNAKSFYNKRLHIQFEKADEQNRTDWFAAAKVKYSECMDVHVRMTQGVFEFENYHEWKTNREEEEDDLAEYRRQGLTED